MDLQEGLPDEFIHHGAKDGSIPTHPGIPIQDPKPEAKVLTECLNWLKKRGIPCDRLNNGTLQTVSGWHVYGISGGGDIVGWMSRSGVHFEVECKAGKGGRLREEQQKRKKKLLTSNAIYVIIHDVTELEFEFDKLRKHWSEV